MKAVSTVVTAKTVWPNTRPSMRIQSTSYTRPVAPERKKQATTPTSTLRGAELTNRS